MPPRACLIALALLAGCDQGPDPGAPPTEPVTEAPWAAEERQLQVHLETEADTRLRRLSVSADGFSDAVKGLLEDPSEGRLGTARQAWRHLYESFSEAAVVLGCRAAGSTAARARLQRSDSFPILPGYIDGLKDWPDSGIVNDPALPLSREALLEQQGATREGEASVGFQVIHFLLNGEPDAPRRADDFVPATADPETQLSEQDLPRNRRREYLRLATSLLVDDLRLLAQRENAALAVDARCPVAAMREAVASLLRLESLRENTELSQEYLAADAQAAAVQGLQAALAPWLAAESPLRPWLEARAAGAPAPAPTLPGPDAKARMRSLQQLHADLAAAERALSAGRR